MDHQTSHSAIGRGWLRIHHNDTKYGEYCLGEYVDKRGFVSVYRQDGLTRLDLVANGKLVMRSWKAWLPDRTITRRAREMLAEYPSPLSSQEEGS